MTFQLVFTDQYRKHEEKFLKQHPDMLKRYTRTLRQLELNPNYPGLRLHQLHGPLEGLHSVSITRFYRITVELEICGGRIIPIEVGSHDSVY